MGDDTPKPILIPMPDLTGLPSSTSSSGTSGAPTKRRTTKKRAAKKRVAKKKAVKKRVSSLDAQIRDLVETKGKIHAIKFYRERTGTGLKEAKEAVEAIVG